MTNSSIYRRVNFSLTWDVLTRNSIDLLLGMCATGWRRRIGCLIFISHFPQKSPIIRGFLSKRDCLIFLSHFPQKSPIVKGFLSKRDCLIFSYRIFYKRALYLEAFCRKGIGTCDLRRSVRLRHAVLHILEEYLIIILSKYHYYNVESILLHDMRVHFNHRRFTRLWIIGV